MFKPNVKLGDKQTAYVCVPTGATFDDVINILNKDKFIIDPNTFKWLAEIKKYPEKVKPGRYQLTANMNNNELINLLRSGKQKPVKLVFNNIRTKEQFAGRIADQIEADSLSIINILNNNSFLEKYNFTSQNVMVMFIPNTYEIYWNTSAVKFFDRMNHEYIKFWNKERIDKAASVGLTAVEVSILASIVQSETTKKDEMSRIAGAYINRLNKGMLLQADPTVVYAWGDFSIRRLLKKHLEIDSPFNTYKYSGLPPGPITISEASTIDKVLNYEKHDYIFFCAREDLSGYHAFAKTLAEHSANARKYQRALDKLNIK